jgi:hypothetical protein
MSAVYFTNANASGSVRYGQLPGSTAVLRASGNRLPIGIASLSDRSCCLLPVGLGDLAHELGPRHVHGPVDLPSLWPRVVL